MQLVYSKITFYKAHVGLLLLCKQNSKLNSVFDGKDEKFRMTNLEWGVDFFSLTNLVKTS